MSDLDRYAGASDDEFIDMLVEDGDLTRGAALALIRHVHHTMDSAYRGIIVLIYGRAWISLKMDGPVEMIDYVLNGRELRLSHTERNKIIRLLDKSGLTREQIAKALSLNDTGEEPPALKGNSHKGIVPTKVPKSIQPQIRAGRQIDKSWLRPTTAPFTVPERREIEQRLNDLITPVSRSRTIRSLQSAAGHVASAAGVDHKQEAVSQILLQMASLKGVLMDEALQACYLPAGQQPEPGQEDRALNALARWYIAWQAASAPRRD